jgi:hypothetical protein
MMPDSAGEIYRKEEKKVSGPDLLPQREIDEKWVITRSGCPRSQGIIDREVNASLPASGVRVMEINKNDTITRKWKDLRTHTLRGPVSVGGEKLQSIMGKNNPGM